MSSSIFKIVTLFMVFPNDTKASKKEKDPIKSKTKFADKCEGVDFQTGVQKNLEREIRVLKKKLKEANINVARLEREAAIWR